MMGCRPVADGCGNCGRAQQHHIVVGHNDVVLYQSRPSAQPQIIAIHARLSHSLSSELLNGIITAMLGRPSWAIDTHFVAARRSPLLLLTRMDSSPT